MLIDSEELMHKLEVRVDVAREMAQKKMKSEQMVGMYFYRGYVSALKSACALVVELEEEQEEEDERTN